MPGVPVPMHRKFEALLNQLSNRLTNLEQQQQATITNGSGQPIYTTGLVPGSNPAMYGLQFVNQAFSAPLAFFGEDGAGNVALNFYDASGNVTSKVDATGFHFYDDSGTEHARIGLLNASPAMYGLGVLPYGGTGLQQVGGAESIGIVQALSVTAASWTDFPGTSSLTTEIGPSGSALVSVQNSISTGVATQQGTVGVSTDGATAQGFGSISSGAGGVSFTGGTTLLLSGMTAGTHVFQLQYITANNGASNCTFAAEMSIQPL